MEKDLNTNKIYFFDTKYFEIHFQFGFQFTIVFPRSQ